MQLINKLEHVSIAGTNMSCKGGLDTMSLTNKHFNYMGKRFKTLYFIE
jgi:hypothetical protein